MRSGSQYLSIMNKEKKIHIAIADDYKVFREAIKKCIEGDKSLELVFEADNGKELISGFEKIVPDVVIMDLKMPVMDGMETTKFITKNFPGVKVLVVTMYGEEKFIRHLMDIGANGYLLKNAEPEEIRRSVYAVYENGYYFNDLISTELLKELSVKNNIQLIFKEDIQLTKQELEVLKLTCDEKDVEAIAKEINVTPAIVIELHKHLIGKIGVRNVAGLVMFAIKNGIIT